MSALNVSRCLVPALALLLVAACGSPERPLPPLPEIDAPLRAEPACFETLAAVLSDDAMEGRGVGTAGLETASRVIAREMQRAGLEPAADGWRQSFDAIVGVEQGDGNALSVGGEVLQPGTDFTPLGFTSNGTFEGNLVFAGFGIRADEPAYDDYAGIDVSGKVVLAMRFEPGEDDPDSPFDGRRPTRWSDLRYKAFVAREAGAAALVLVDPPREESDEESRTRLPALRALGPVSRAGLPVVQVTMDVADRWLEPSGLTLDAVVKEIASDYRPRSREIPGVRVSGTTDVTPVLAEVANIAGVIPGSGPLADEYVVIGAHYDHLGYGGRGSMRPGEEAIHNGADDNASGVAALVCAAGELASQTPENDGARRSVLAIAFTAEELGLGGSGWYVDHPLVPIEQTVAMVNLDMVGRVRDDKLRALGTDSAEGWQQLVEASAEPTGLVVEPGGDGYGPSDQTPFYERGVPVVHLFSGAHEEYHTPDDDAPLLNIDGGARVARLLAGLTGALAVRGERLAWAPPAEIPAMSTDSRGYGAYLGTIPDYTAMSAPEGGGVLLSGVRPGGPADRGGVKGGDTLVGLAGITIDNLYDMTFALREHKPGDTVSVVVLRDGERIELSATLGKRGE